MHTKDSVKAFHTYIASKQNNIHPMLLTALINSESSYRDNVNHGLGYVKGMAGINHKYWDIPNDTTKEQIQAGANVLAYYLHRFKGDELKALVGYKGISKEGRALANKTYKKYMEGKKRWLSLNMEI